MIAGLGDFGCCAGLHQREHQRRGGHDERGGAGHGQVAHLRAARLQRLGRQLQQRARVPLAGRVCGAPGARARGRAAAAGRGGAAVRARPGLRSACLGLRIDVSWRIHSARPAGLPSPRRQTVLYNWCAGRMRRSEALQRMGMRGTLAWHAYRELSDSAGVCRRRLVAKGRRLTKGRRLMTALARGAEPGVAGSDALMARAGGWAGRPPRSGAWTRRPSARANGPRRGRPRRTRCSGAPTTCSQVAPLPGGPARGPRARCASRRFCVPCAPA